MQAWQGWVHVMSSTRGHWLPGDVRGFRDHDRRVHSSGDYKTPPPKDEHAGLRAYADRITQRRVSFKPAMRPAIGEAMLRKFEYLNVAVRVLAVGETHVHVLARIGNEDAKEVFGRVKQYASHQVRRDLKGTIWGEGSYPVRIADHEHYRVVVEYIRDHAAEGAWVWENPRATSRGEVK